MMSLGGIHPFALLPVDETLRNDTFAGTVNFVCGGKLCMETGIVSEVVHGYRSRRCTPITNSER